MLSIIHVFVVTFTPIWHLSMDLLSFYSVEIKPLSQRSGEKLSEMLLPSVGCLRRQELFNWKGNLILSKLSFQLACIFLHCNKHHLQILEGLKEKYFVHPQSHWFSKQYNLSFAVGVFLGKSFFPVEEIRARDFKIIKKAMGLRELAALVMRLSSSFSMLPNTTAGGFRARGKCAWPLHRRAQERRVSTAQWVICSST